MKNKILIYILLVVICSFLVAGGEYLHYGADNYEQDKGFFYQGYTDYQTLYRSVGGANGIPLVANLDGEGENEIVVPTNDGIFIYMFNYAGFFLIDSYEPIGGFDSFMQVELSDIDEDGMKEIIAVDSVRVHVIHFNSGSINSTTSYTYGIAGTKYSAIRCNGGSDCFMYWVNGAVVGTGYKSVESASLGATGIIDTETIQLDTSTAYKGFCMPDNKHIEYTDVDHDGEDEFVFTYARVFSGSSPEYLYIASVHFNASNHIEVEKLFGNSAFDWWSGASGESCFSQGVGREFTSPVVDEFDGSESNGMEIVVAQMISSNAFKMYAYGYASTTVKDDFPEITDGEGQLISNVFRADIFPDTGSKDFCVMGYNDASLELDLLCGSLKSAEFIDTREFIYRDYNGTLGTTRTDWTRLATATDMDRTIIIDNTGAFNPSEFVTSYGVLGITEYHDSGAFKGELDIFFDFMVGEKVLVPIDYENNGYEDLIGLTQSHIIYVDDNFINRPAWLEQVIFDPCIKDEVTGSPSIWKKTTNAQIDVAVSDPEFDTTSARVTLYSGTVYEMTPDAFDANDGWSDYIASGTLGAHIFSSVYPSASSFSEDDNFECGTLSCGSGWLTSWNVTGAQISTASSPRGSYHLEFDGTDSAYRNFTANSSVEFLIGYNVTFWSQSDPLEVADTCVYMIYNGTHEIVLHTISSGYQDDNAYRYNEFDIMAHLQDTYSISLGVKADGGVDDDCYIDDIELTPILLSPDLLNQKILIEYRDIENPLLVSNTTFYFNVADDGVEKGDCTYSVVYQDPDTIPDEDEDEEDDRSKIADAIEGADRAFGLNLGKEVIWLIAMLFIGLIIFRIEHIESTHRIGALALFEILMLIIGIKLEFVGIATLIVIVIIALAIISFNIRSKIFGGGY